MEYNINITPATGTEEIIKVLEEVQQENKAQFIKLIEQINKLSEKLEQIEKQNT